MSPLITRRSDSTNKTYVFQSAAAPNAYWVELSDLNLAPGSGQRIVDAYDVSLAGDVTKAQSVGVTIRPGSTFGGWANRVVNP